MIRPITPPVLAAALTAVLAGILAALLAPAPAAAQDKPAAAAAPETDTLLSADEVTYDEGLATVTATGRVEVSYADRILVADSVSYNQKTAMVVASGHVSLVEPDGTVLFADYAEVTDDLREGFIKGIRILLADKSRMAANAGRRTGGNRSELTKAVYSPCDLCADKPDRAPLWQIKAVKVIHDQARKTIEYRHAFLEVYGVPVLYTPYLSHPDPSVERQSGFLLAKAQRSGRLGINVQTPYYMVIDSSRDVTLTPYYTENDGPILMGEYRHRTAQGQFKGEASATRTYHRDGANRAIGERQFRGHIDAEGRWELDDVWRWGFDVERTTDDTYLRRYGIQSRDMLTSQAFVEGLSKLNYAALSAQTYQGLLVQDDPSTTPLVAPEALYHWASEPLLWGSNLTVDASSVALFRDQGSDSRRLSLTSAWTLPHVGPFGDVTTITAELRGDLYHVDDVATQVGRPAFDGAVGRVRPALGIDWRYPWVSDIGRIRQLIEPQIGLVVAPYGGNPDGIPNDDSRSFEFDDSNLFSMNRFAGHDRVDGGPRLNYGMKYGVYGSTGGYTEAFLGQSLRAEDDDTYSERSGLEGRRSDYVTRLTVSPASWLDLGQRLRLDRSTLSIRRNEIEAAAGPDWLRIGANYAAVDGDAVGSGFGAREQISGSAQFTFLKFWTIGGTHAHDLTDDGGPLNFSTFLGYRDECLEFVFTAGQSYTRDRDVDPDTSFGFRIRLRNLG